MKKLYIILAVTLMALMTSCHKPEYVTPTADRQGLTSITAYFTFGPYVDQEICKLDIADDSQERYVIPVPYYYPMESDDETTMYMYKVRLRAELQPNFSLSPGLSIVDLTEENWYTYTDPFGESRRICITGERTKSSECEIKSFVITSPSTITGVIDKNNFKITLPTKDDVSACKAKVQISAHATITPDPSKVRDYTDGQKFTVTADDGTQATYLVETGEPEKIDMGFDPASAEQLFNFDPVSRLGFPPYTMNIPVSLACLEGNLIVCKGDGSKPVILNGLNGTKVGELNTGSAVVGSVTSDEGGNMLITNVANGGESITLYRMKSSKEAPALFAGFENPSDCPIGHKMKVIGNIDKDAAIVFTAEGIDGVTTTAKMVCLTVRSGAVSEIKTVDFAGLGFGWGSAPVNTATTVAASTDPDRGGWFNCFYEGNFDADGADMLHYVTGGLKDNVIAGIGNWAYNPNCLDSKTFNNVRYMTLFVVSHFPMWGIGPMIYVYNISDPASPSLVLSNEAIPWYQAGASGCASGDVIISPSSDGYKVYIYYYDHNSQVVGGYVADCIKRG